MQTVAWTCDNVYDIQLYIDPVRESKEGNYITFQWERRYGQSERESEKETRANNESKSKAAGKESALWIPSIGTKDRQKVFLPYTVNRC